jgi:hypothetical protein
MLGGVEAEILTLTVPSFGVQDQDKVELCPEVIESGLAQILTVGFGGLLQ